MNSSASRGLPDRRVPVPPELIRAGRLIDRVYEEQGLRPDAKKGSKNDPDSRISRELQAKRLGLRHLEPEDRRRVESCVEALTERAEIGEEAALDVLMRIGLLLSRYGYREEP